MEIESLFRQNPVFRSLTERERTVLLQQGIKRAYQKGEYLANAGEPWPYLFLLVGGSVSAVKESFEGRSLLATTFTAGEIFWGVAFFYPDLPMPVDLRARGISIIQSAV